MKETDKLELTGGCRTDKLGWIGGWWEVRRIEGEKDKINGTRKFLLV